MSGDYTRFTFDPTRVFSGVHKQQGRVSLDADFNEFEEILDRRDRSEMYDTVGRAVVPATTPHGFEIGVSGNELTIGVGRVYVDGIQAECFGDLSDPTKTDFDRFIGDLVGAAALAYEDQPFRYAKGFPAISPTSGDRNLVYLDVWQREVTAWEDASLIEPALGGPDTATRVQTAWQVKAMPTTEEDPCASTPAAWMPSTGRMSATAATVPPAPGPCVIQPAGGYVGLENRLYRVEIHDEGTLGGASKASFKWSRDNASLVASVLKVTSSAGGTESVITVESTGRDTWMRFEKSQEIELLDDDVEFAMRESKTAGKIARIKAINHATGEITVDRDLSTYLVVKKERHPRVRRWDADPLPGNAVRSVNNGTPIALEDGIYVTFGDLDPQHDGDTLHAGDYWVFAARTADGSIESFVDAPPRGILHHYMALAVATSGTPPTVEDCRNPWPVPCDCEGGGCDCDACVTAESHRSGDLTIQKAIKQVIDAGGGTVCIGIGTFPLNEQRIEISGAVSLRMRGAGIATIINYNGPGPALAIDGSLDVVVHDLTVVTERSGQGAEDAIEISNAALVTLERLVVVEDPIGVIGFLEERTVTRLVGSAVGLSGFVLRTAIRDCVLAGGEGVVARPWILGDAKDYLVVADLAIEHDLIFATSFGVGLGSTDQPGAVTFLDRTAITSCSIFGCEEVGIKLSGSVIEGEVVIRDNTLGAIGRGMWLSTDGTTADNNTVASWGRSRRESGISIARGDAAIIRDVRLDRNRVTGFGLAGIDIDASVVNLAVDENAISECGGGIVMLQKSTGDTVTVSGNEIIDVVSEENDDDPSRFGIALVSTTDGQIVDNTVKRIATKDTNSRWRAGIQIIGCRSVRIAGNIVDQVGPNVLNGISVGIGATDGFEQLDVLDNTVRPSMEGIDGRWYALLIGPADESFMNNTFVIGEARYFAVGASIDVIGPRDRQSSAAVRGNHLESAAPVPTVEIQTGGSCTFSDNWCRRRTRSEQPVVQMGMAILALTSNQVRQESGEGRVAISVEGLLPAPSPAPSNLAISAVGNLTDGSINVNNGSALVPPWDQLNVRLT